MQLCSKTKIGWLDHFALKRENVYSNFKIKIACSCARSAQSTDAAFCGCQSASRTTRQALDSRQLSLRGCRSRVWNALPEEITSSSSQMIFCRRLKAWLFRKSFPDIIVWLTLTLLTFLFYFANPEVALLLLRYSDDDDDDDDDGGGGGTPTKMALRPSVCVSVCLCVWLFVKSPCVIRWRKQRVTSHSRVQDGGCEQSPKRARHPTVDDRWRHSVGVVGAWRHCDVRTCAVNRDERARDRSPCTRNMSQSKYGVSKIAYNFVFLLSVKYKPIGCNTQ